MTQVSLLHESLFFLTSLALGLGLDILEAQVNKLTKSLSFLTITPSQKIFDGKLEHNGEKNLTDLQTTTLENPILASSYEE